MAFVVEAMRQHPRSEGELADLFAGGWPVYIDADALAAEHLPTVRERFADFELALVLDGRLAAAGWGVPIVWDGDVASLPAGYSETLAQAVVPGGSDPRSAAGSGEAATCFVVCAVQVRPDLAGNGMAATTLLEALVALADSRGCTRVLAPLRPTLKHRYPLIPIEQYATWTRDDAAPFDPWLRLHTRLGASVLATTDSSQVFTGTVAQWEGWTGLSMPGSGSYIINGALAPLRVDREADRGTSHEPGIWVQHR